MQKLTVTIDPDERVKIPGTSAGQTITIHIEPEREADQQALSMLSPEEQKHIIQELLEAGRRARAEATPEEIELAVNHGDWLYGPDGLPR